MKQKLKYTKKKTVIKFFLSQTYFFFYQFNKYLKAITFIRLSTYYRLSLLSKYRLEMLSNIHNLTFFSI